MLTPGVKLSPDLFDQAKLEQRATRDGYGLGLVEAGEKDQSVMALTADLTESTRALAFAEKFSKRFIQVGIAEQNLVAVAAGLAAAGKIPFISSYAAFSPGRNYEPIRTMVCINDLPVKIAGHHAGVSVGPDGATHQMLEDIALMRALPNMIVMVPCDAVEAEKATMAAAFNDKPTYLRFSREKSPVFTTPETPFAIGKALVLRRGKDVSLIGCGPLLYNALVAAEELSKAGIECEVINCHTVKPLDSETILTSVQKTRAVVSIEEHQITGGLGGAIAELLAQKLPTAQEFIGVHDHFGESGTAAQLIEKFGMDEKAIILAIKRVVARKSG